MLSEFKFFIKSHCDFKMHTCTWIALLVALMIIPCILFMPEKYGYENGLLENLQMLTLLAGFIFALKSKINKKFFYLTAMVIVILAIREVNCGRTIFLPFRERLTNFILGNKLNTDGLHILYMEYTLHTLLFTF